MYFKIEVDINWPNAVDGQGLADYNWQPVYDPESDNEFVRSVYNSSGSKAIGEAGSLTFTMPKGHPLYGIIPNTPWYYIDVLQTAVRVVATLAGNRTAYVWTGRVTSIDTDFMLNKVVQCEGALSYLGDIIARPYVYYNPCDDTEERNATPPEYISHLMTYYNSRCSVKRKFALPIAIDTTLFGCTMSGSTANWKEIVQGNSDYTSTREAVDTLIGKDSHSMILPLYESDMPGFKIIDIYHYRENEAASAIITLHGNQNVRANLISSDKEITGSDVFTIVIPLAKDKEKYEYTISGVTTDYVSGTTINHYGVIEKVINFDDVDVMNWNNGQEYSPYPTSEIDPVTGDVVTVWNYRKNITELGNRAMAELAKMEDTAHYLNVQAVDLSMIDPNQGFIDIGYKVQVIDDDHGLSGYYIVTSVDFDFDNPGATSYTLYPMGRNFMMHKLNKISNITAKDSKSLKTGTEFANEEGMYNLVKVEKGHVKAVNQNWEEHYVLTKSDLDGGYILETYRADLPSS